MVDLGRTSLQTYSENNCPLGFRSLNEVSLQPHSIFAINRIYPVFIQKFLTEFYSLACAAAGLSVSNSGCNRLRISARYLVSNSAESHGNI